MKPYRIQNIQQHKRYPRKMTQIVKQKLAEKQRVSHHSHLHRDSIPFWNKLRYCAWNGSSNSQPNDGSHCSIRPFSLHKSFRNPYAVYRFLPLEATQTICLLTSCLICFLLYVRYKVNEVTVSWSKIWSIELERCGAEKILSNRVVAGDSP